LGAPHPAEPDADLPERGERNAETVRRAGFLLQLDAALGERQRLVVPVLNRRDVRWVAAGGRGGAAGRGGGGEPLGLAEGGHRFVEPPLLRERDAAQRVHQRQAALITRRVQRRRRLRDVLADDRRVPDVPVAETQLVVRQSDGARVVGALGLFQRAAEERDGTRRLAFRNREACVKAPQVRQPKRVQPLALFRRIAKRVRGLAHLVLLEPGFGERTPDLHHFVTGEAGLLERTGQERRRVRAPPLPESLRGGHGGEYTLYTGWLYRRLVRESPTKRYVSNL